MRAAMHLLLSDARRATRRRSRCCARRRARRSRAERPRRRLEFLRRAEREPPPASRPVPRCCSSSGSPPRAPGSRTASSCCARPSGSPPGQPARAHAGLELGFALGVSRSGSAEAIEVLERAREGLEDEELRALLDARMVMFTAVRRRADAGCPRRCARCAPRLERPPSDAAPRVRRAARRGPACSGGRGRRRSRGSPSARSTGGELMRRDVATESDFALGRRLVCSSTPATCGSAKHHVDDGRRARPDARIAASRWRGISRLPGAGPSGGSASCRPRSPTRTPRCRSQRRGGCPTRSRRPSSPGCASSAATSPAAARGPGCARPIRRCWR